MADIVLDSSAVLALLLAEPGSDRVASVISGACLCAVNAAEVISKLCERGVPAAAAREALDALGLEVVDFDMARAEIAGGLRPATRALGLSLGDRACLALAKQQGVAAMTADAAWQAVPGIQAVLIR